MVSCAGPRSTIEAMPVSRSSTNNFLGAPSFLLSRVAAGRQNFFEPPFELQTARSIGEFAARTVYSTFQGQTWILARYHSVKLVTDRKYTIAASTQEEKVLGQDKRLQAECNSALNEKPREPAYRLRGKGVPR